MSYKVDPGPWSRLHGELLMAYSQPLTRQARKSLLDRAARQGQAMAKQAPRGAASANSSLYEVKEAHATLKSAIVLRRSEESDLQAIWRLVLGVIGIRDGLQVSFRQVGVLLQAAGHHLCEEDRRFLLLLTTVLEDVAQAPAHARFDWQLLAEGQPRYSADDAAFFSYYIEHISERAGLSQALASLAHDHRVRNLMGPVSPQAHRLACSLLEVCAPDQIFGDMARLRDLSGRIADFTVGLRTDPGHVADADARVSLSDMRLAIRARVNAEPLKQLAALDLLPAAMLGGMADLEKMERGLALITGEVLNTHKLEAGDLGFARLSKGRFFYNAKDPYRPDIGVMATRTPYVHGGILRGNFMQSHLTVAGFADDTFGMEARLKYDVFRLDWQRLVTSAGRSQLEAMWGDSWSSQLQAAYAAQTQAFFADTRRFEGLKNTTFHQKVSPLRLHTRMTDNEVENMNFSNTTMMCTEFVARSLHVTMHRLEAQLRTMLADHSPNPGEATPSSGPLLQPVFSPRENFAAAHPGYLLRRLRAFGDFLPTAGALSGLVHPHECPAPS